MEKEIDEILKQKIENIERLESEKKEISTDVNSIYTELDSLGFDKKVIKKIVALRKLDRNTMIEQEFLLGEYKVKLGM